MIFLFGFPDKFKHIVTSVAILGQYITINVPFVFYGARLYTGANALQGPLEGVGPENRDFFAPCKSNERSYRIFHFSCLMTKVEGSGWDLFDSSLDRS
jgi:hypothetical protein